MVEPEITKGSLSIIKIKGKVVNKIVEQETAPQRTVLIRGCKNGNNTKTIEPHDNCISKLEFKKKE